MKMLKIRGDVKGIRVLTSFGEIFFDSNGIATVPEKMGLKLLKNFPSWILDGKEVKVGDDVVHPSEKKKVKIKIVGEGKDEGRRS